MQCKSCKQQIEADAIKCHHCGSLQNAVLNKLQSVALVLSTLVALVSLYGAYSAEQQAGEARAANKNAEEALDKIRHLDDKLASNLVNLNDKIQVAGTQRDEISKAAKEALDAASKAKAISVKLDVQQKEATEKHSAQLNDLKIAVSDAKDSIKNLINVAPGSDNNVIDIDNKVRVQWGGFTTNSESNQVQKRIHFPAKFADSNIAIALTIVGDPSAIVEGKSVIAKNISATGFMPRVSERGVLFGTKVALGVEVTYLAFGASPNK